MKGLMRDLHVYTISILMQGPPRYGGGWLESPNYTIRVQNSKASLVKWATPGVHLGYLESLLMTLHDAPPPFSDFVVLHWQV